MKFLIAGLGSIGRRHLRNLMALGEEDIILYRTGKSTLPEDELEGFPTEYSLEDALGHDPDAVIISNPTALHLDVAIPAAKQGCHLLIEKPVSHSLERLDELERAVRAYDCRVLIGFQFRFHPAIRALKHAVDAGEIGTPIYARAHWGEYLPNWHPWEDHRESYAARKDLGGGVALTLCHPFDYLRFLFGEAREISGWVARRSTLDLSVDDIAEATMEFEDGCIASVHLNYFQRPAAHRVEIVGSNGTLSWSHSSKEVTLELSDDDRSNYFATEGDFERNDVFLAEMEHFIRVVSNEEPSLCTLRDGIEALKLVLALKPLSGTDNL